MKNKLLYLSLLLLASLFILLNGCSGGG